MARDGTCTGAVPPKEVFPISPRATGKAAKLTMAAVMTSLFTFLVPSVLLMPYLSSLSGLVRYRTLVLVPSPAWVLRHPCNG